MLFLIKLKYILYDIFKYFLLNKYNENKIKNKNE